MNAKIMDQEIEAGIRNGFWFFFEIDGHQVTVHNSAISGRERIWVDDNLVASGISWLKTSRRSIEIDGRPVEVNLSLPSWLVARVTCTLRHNGEQIAFAEKELRADKPTSPWAIATSVLLGMVAGYAVVRVLLALVGVE